MIVDLLSNEKVRCGGAAVVFRPSIGLLEVELGDGGLVSHQLDSLGDLASSFSIAHSEARIASSCIVVNAEGEDVFALSTKTGAMTKVSSIQRTTELDE
ncbi:MAG: hypothetical protein AAFQ82_26345, partial [Myxococcota bacterium]